MVVDASDLPVGGMLFQSTTTRLSIIQGIMRLEVTKSANVMFCLRGPACGNHSRDTSITDGCIVHSLIPHVIALFQHESASRI